jgi:hypothetical protein
MSKESEAKTRVIQRQAAGKGLPTADGQLVFACPNGHRIVVAAALAGKRGKCSKCGVAVEIPRAATASEPAAAAAGPSASPEPPPPLAETREFPVTGLVVGLTPEPSQAATESWDFIGEPSDAEEWPAGVPAATPFADVGHPTASLVARLWAERAHGGVIELHLANGSVILPEWYDANWSRGSHGLFASQAADATVTLTAVAWESVQKVIVRKLTAVPDDMFE